MSFSKSRSSVLSHFIVIALVIGFGSNAQAEVITMPKLYEPELTDAVKEEIGTKSKDELKVLQADYGKSVWSAITYVRLTSGEVVDPPYTRITYSKESIYHNVLNFKESAYDVYPKLNKLIDIGRQEVNPVALFLTDITLSTDQNSCTINPIFMTIHMAQMQSIPLSCVDNSGGKNKLDTKIVLAFGTDFVLRTEDKDIVQVNMIDDKIHTLDVDLETYNENIGVQMTFHYKVK